jgi:hypothetical protein
VGALAAAREIGKEWGRAKALTALAPHLPEPLGEQALGEALAAARKIRDAEVRAWVLIGLIPHLSEELLGEALAAAREIGDAEYRARALARLASRLAELGYPKEALAVAREIGDAEVRARVLSGLAPHLAESMGEQALGEALAVAREIGNEWARVKALARLASRLAELGYPKEALVAAREVRDADGRAQALIDLIPHLPEGLLGEALATAREIGDEQARARALGRLAAAQEADPEEWLRKVLRAETGKEDWNEDWVMALVELIKQDPHGPDLPEWLLVGALAGAQEIRNTYDRALALTSLAPHLPEGLLGEALGAARELPEQERFSVSPRVEALTGLIPHLPEALLGEALAAAREIGDTDGRAKVLAGLPPHLARLPRQRLYPLWRETLPILAARTRKDLLADLHALGPVIAALGGEEGVAETFRAIQDVGRWWP